MSFTVIIIIFLSVIIMNGSSAITGLYSFSSFFLGLSFVFGDAAKTLFNSCIFVFIVHPFDVVPFLHLFRCQECRLKFGSSGR